MGGADALLKLAEGNFGTLLLDPWLEDLEVGELLATVRARHPAVHVVVLDGAAAPPGPLELNSARVAVRLNAQKSGDRSFFGEYSLPIDPQDRAENDSGTTELLPGMIGSSWAIRRVCRLARLVAPRKAAVLVTGATGTGKELVARGIHAVSPRSAGPFVVVNCAAIPESLLEAELFGFVRGAFTGAFQSRLGRIHAAHGGTLLLDEIGELPTSMQAKLLRFVQEGEVQRLGSADVFRVDARVIAATNADLLRRVREKQFREDLYYRLSTFPLDLPPLRKRPEDILPLAKFFLEKLCEESGLPPKSFNPQTSRFLSGHAWPGNIRELQHAIERALILSGDRRQLRADDFDGMPLALV